MSPMHERIRTALQTLAVAIAAWALLLNPDSKDDRQEQIPITCNALTSSNRKDMCDQSE